MVFKLKQVCEQEFTSYSNLVRLTAAGIVLSGQAVPTGSGSSIVVNTHKGNATGLSSMASSSFATINKRMQAKTLVQVQTVSTKSCLVRT